MQICIISCGKKKIWDINPVAEKVAAKDAYIGLYFKTNRAYAEKFFDRWYILSAKYGFLKPTTLIENYNAKLGKKRTNPITLDELTKQAKEMIRELSTEFEITVLGGRIYREMTKKAFKGYIVKELEILKGKGIGKQIALLQKAIRDNIPLA